MHIGDPRPKPFSLAPVIKSYKAKLFKADLLAAVSVALLSLPQAIAYAILAGLPIESGVLAAIFGTIFTAAFGKSPHLVAGPSTAVAILLQTTISSTLAIYYPNAQEEEKLALTFHILTHIVFFVGVFHLISSYCNVAKILQFVSKPVILGYFGGVCLAIVTSQLDTFFGLTESIPRGVTLTRLIYFFTHLHTVDSLQLVMSVLSLIILFSVRKFFPKWPSAFVMVTFISLLLYVLEPLFPYKPAVLGSLGKGFGFDIAFPFFDFQLMGIIFPSAAAIAILSLLEVFSISRNLSSKSGVYSTINQEIFGSGMGNLLLSFLHGSMPTSASTTRSMLNYLGGARTRFAAIFSGVFVAILIFLFTDLVSYLSMSAIAALLIGSSLSLIQKHQISLCIRTTKADAAVFSATFLSSIFFSLDVAFYIGIILSIATYLGRSSIPHFVEYAFNRAGRLTIVTSKKSAKRHVRIIGIGGELFFGVVDLLQLTIQAIGRNPYVKVIVLRLNGVYHADASICLAILHLHQFLQNRGKHLVISGISPEVWPILFHSHIVDKMGKENFFLAEEQEPQLSTWKACLRAQEIIEEN